MKLTIIGMTGSVDGAKSPASCYLLQGPDPENPVGLQNFNVVMDLGFGAFGALQQFISPSEINAVMLSHLHADHMVDMSALAVYSRWSNENMETIDVYGPAQTLKRIQDVDWSPRMDHYVNEFKFFDFFPGAIFQVGPFRVEVFEAYHTVEAYCLRIEQTVGPGKGKILCFSGDTDTCPGVLRAANGADLFLCEAGFPETETDPGVHLTGRRAGELAQKAGVKNLLITHIQPWVDSKITLQAVSKRYDGPLALAHPGLCVTV